MKTSIERKCTCWVNHYIYFYISVIPLYDLIQNTKAVGKISGMEILGMGLDELYGLTLSTTQKSIRSE